MPTSRSLLVGLALLPGCGGDCPTFAEMTVEDPDGLATAEQISTIEQAIADFAAWTGREGVCVPGVVMEKDMTSEGEEIDGAYRGTDEPIGVDVEGGATSLITTHELCHAIDRLEDHSVRRTDLFPARDVEESVFYETAYQRRGEAFARACERGPEDVSTLLWLDGTCGTALVDPTTTYLQEVIYPLAAPAWDPGSTSFQVETGSFTLGPDYTIQDAIFHDGSMLLLAYAWRYDPLLQTIGWITVDPSTGTPSDFHPLPFSGLLALGAVLARTDGAVVVDISGDGETGQIGGELYRLDVDGGTAEPLPRPITEQLQAMAVSEGVVYAETVATEPCSTDGCPSRRLSAWDLESGAAVAVAEAPSIDALLPVAGGIMAAVVGGYARLDVASGTWTGGSFPEPLELSLVLPDGRLLLALPGGETPRMVTYNVDRGTTTVLGEPCVPLVAPGPWTLDGAEPVLLGGVDGTVPFYRLAIGE